jgi:hypothetical protein
MALANAQRADEGEVSQVGNRPVARFKHGGIELSMEPLIWGCILVN